MTLLLGKHIPPFHIWGDRGEKEVLNRKLKRLIEGLQRLFNPLIPLLFAGWLPVVLIYCSSRIGHRVCFRKDQLQNTAELRINITWRYVPGCEHIEVWCCSLTEETNSFEKYNNQCPKPELGLGPNSSEEAPGRCIPWEFTTPTMKDTRS